MRTQMLLCIVAACQEHRGQHTLAEWCFEASDEHIPAIWARAVAVLKLPKDVRDAARWN